MRPTDVRFDLYERDALYDSETAFLGILKEGISPLMCDGTCFVAPNIPPEGKLLRRFYDAFWKKKNMGRTLSFGLRKEAQKDGAGTEEDPIWLNGITIGNVLRIHVSPDKTIALFIIHFRLPHMGGALQSLQKVQSTNYWLHKTDHQAPTIYVEGKVVTGYETILNIITTLLNSNDDVAALYRPGRLLTATYVQVNPPLGMSAGDANVFMDKVCRHVVSIGQSKDHKYEIAEDNNEAIQLFNNIIVHVSPEGFCGTFINEDEKDNSSFMSKSSTTFLKSYLPIFIECVLVDLISVNMLSQKGKKDDFRLRVEQFRELKLMSVMPVSRYSHLQQLKSIISDALSIPPKIETVSGYLEMLREQSKQRQESNLNILIGFMGVGQVVFAIIELSKESHYASSLGWHVAAYTLSIIFGVLALFISFVVVLSYIKRK